MDLAEEEPEIAAAMLGNITVPEQTVDGDPSNFGGVWSSGWC